MLRINRLRIEIHTANGIYGRDEEFDGGLNFVASLDNTSGKSSILAGVYYCLGFEQILGGSGGTGSKVMTSVFKTAVEDGENTWPVTKSDAYLEISNGSKTVTIHRNIKADGKDNRLVTVYYGGYDDISSPQTSALDYYVHYHDAATAKKGFHAFLEEFLHLELPLVRASDGNERKLYLQILFASMFIEQKHGWSDILSGMPVFGIRESKKRVVEYVLGLGTFKNERARERLNAEKTRIEQAWKQLISEIQVLATSRLAEIANLPATPRVLNDTDISRIVVVVDEGQLVDDVIVKLQEEHSSLNQLKPLVVDNFEALNIELSDTESLILTLETDAASLGQQIRTVSTTITNLESNIEIINSDIRNNVDAARLQKFGSEVAEGNLSTGICPTCKQHVDDSLLPLVTDAAFMSIDDNIKHLREQKKMLEFSLSSRRKNKNEAQLQKQQIEEKLHSLRRLAQTIRSDLNTSLDTEASEAIMLKRIEITNRIEQFNLLSSKTAALIEELSELSGQWNAYLDQKRKLPSKSLTSSDSEKIDLLKTRFIENLRHYNYSSLSSFDGIGISDESLLPTIDGFDLKFDSSASDGIRVIWAFTMALLQVSIEKDGNHPGVVIFDEPAQQSIVPEDMKNFVESARELAARSQVIMALTLNSQELNDIIGGLDTGSYHMVDISGRAFKKYSVKG
jgi:F0F1-type ATP synthase membrane subunit b/b'